jgi:hypothetical protein
MDFAAFFACQSGGFSAVCPIEPDLTKEKESMKGKRTKAIALALLICLAPATFTGCYGSFPLTKAVYRLNGGINNIFLEQIVFWLFIFFPVYGIATFVDAVILNLIQFWLGDHTETAATTLDDGREVALTPGAAGNEAILSVSRDGVVLDQVRFVRLPNGECVVYDRSGAVTARVRPTQNGDLALCDANGLVVQQIPAARLAQLSTFQRAR